MNIVLSCWMHMAHYKWTSEDVIDWAIKFTTGSVSVSTKTTGMSRQSARERVVLWHKHRLQLTLHKYDLVSLFHCANWWVSCWCWIGMLHGKWLFAYPPHDEVNWDMFHFPSSVLECHSCEECKRLSVSPVDIGQIRYQNLFLQEWRWKWSWAHIVCIGCPVQQSTTNPKGGWTFHLVTAAVHSNSLDDRI